MGVSSPLPSAVAMAPGTRQFAWRPLLRFPLLVCAALLLAELAVRLPAVARWLPAPTVYYDTAVGKRLDVLDGVLASRGRVDVLFIGSSVVRTNVSPLEFDDLVARRANLDVVSFNAGLSGMWPAGVDLYLRRLWLERARPRVVVQAIRYTELAATGFSVDRHLLDGIAEGHWYRDSMVDRVEWWAIEHVRLLQVRGAMGRWLGAFVNGRPGDDTGSARWEIDSRGYTARGPSLEVLLARGLLRGEKPYSGTWEATSGRVGFAALARTLDACRAAGTRYVLVNMPEHAFRWSAPDGRANYARYLAALDDFARQQGIEFVDLSGGNPGAFHDNREFADYHHMTPAGARRVTALLAEHLSATRALIESGAPRVVASGGSEAARRPDSSGATPQQAGHLTRR